MRCVGWLSRHDLATRDGGAGPEFETLGAQEQGPHTFQFAITTYRGGYLEADVMSRIATYIFPPRVFSTCAPAPPVASLQLFSCDNPRVMFSTARRLNRQNAYVARAFSVSPNPETAWFSFGAGRVGRLVDLAVRPLQHLRSVAVWRRREGPPEVEFPMGELVTFRVRQQIFNKIVIKILIDRRFALNLLSYISLPRPTEGEATERKRKKSA